MSPPQKKARAGELREGESRGEREREERVRERERGEMASTVVKNVFKSIREKGLGTFFRDLKDEGYL